MPSKDHHLKTLELSDAATADEIREAWRTLSQIWHPDKHVLGSKPYELALKKQKELNEAYEYLIKNAGTRSQATDSPATSTAKGWWTKAPEDSKSDKLFPAGTNTVEPRQSSSNKPSWVAAHAELSESGWKSVEAETAAGIDGQSKRPWPPKSAGTGPDATINWDDWRNHLVIAILQKAQEKLLNPGASQMKWDRQTNRPLVFPMGISVAVACDIERGRRVADVQVLEPSSDRRFDQLITDSIWSLAGSSVLDFPSGSARSRVTHVTTIGIGESAEFSRQSYGDVEHASGCAEGRGREGSRRSNR